MRRFTVIILSLLLVSTAILPHPIVIAENKPKPSVWSNISRMLFSKKEPPVKPRDAGSRTFGNYVCMISPDAPRVTRVVWSDRPLFIWEGYVGKIAVNRRNVELWSQPILGVQNITYTGKLLKPGETYMWIVNNNQLGVFQIMEQQQRDRISADLQSLEKQLIQQRKNPEAIASAKANYFAERELWADVLQQIYSVKNPSTELVELRTKISEELCKPEEELKK